MTTTERLFLLNRRWRRRKREVFYFCTRYIRAQVRRITAASHRIGTWCLGTLLSLQAFGHCARTAKYKRIRDIHYTKKFSLVCRDGTTVDLESSIQNRTTPDATNATLLSHCLSLVVEHSIWDAMRCDAMWWMDENMLKSKSDQWNPCNPLWAWRISTFFKSIHFDVYWSIDKMNNDTYMPAHKFSTIPWILSIHF